MTYRGHVRNGKVVLDEPAGLPEGAEVRIELPDDTPEGKTETANGSKSFAERYRKFIGVCEGPPDLAKNHDHYIHGTPKKRP